jgi:hypothetical protein
MKLECPFVVFITEEEYETHKPQKNFYIKIIAESIGSLK